MDSQNEFNKEDTTISENAEEEDLPLLEPEEIEEEEKFQHELEKSKYLN